MANWSFWGLNPPSHWSSDPLKSICLHNSCLTDGAGPFIDTYRYPWQLHWLSWLRHTATGLVVGVVCGEISQSTESHCLQASLCKQELKNHRMCQILMLWCWWIYLAWLLACLENLFIASTMTSSENTSSKKRFESTPKKSCSSSLNPSFPLVWDPDPPEASLSR